MNAPSLHAHTHTHTHAHTENNIGLPTTLLVTALPALPDLGKGKPGPCPASSTTR